MGKEAVESLEIRCQDPTWRSNVQSELCGQPRHITARRQNLCSGEVTTEEREKVHGRLADGGPRSRMTSRTIGRVQHPVQCAGCHRVRCSSRGGTVEKTWAGRRFQREVGQNDMREIRQWQRWAPPAGVDTQAIHGKALDSRRRTHGCNRRPCARRCRRALSSCVRWACCWNRP